MVATFPAMTAWSLSLAPTERLQGRLWTGHLNILPRLLLHSGTIGRVSALLGYLAALAAGVRQVYGQVPEGVVEHH